MGRKIKDLTGMSFGRLTVKGLSKNRSTDGRALWICLCSCGKEKIIAGTELARTRSCGCFAREVARDNALSKALSKTDRIVSQKIAYYKYAAKKNSRAFELDKAEFTELIYADCHYCGKPSDKLDKSSINGVDRLDPKDGYVQGNVVACCPLCNQLKWEQSFNEFLDWIRTVHGRRLEWLKGGR
jgi:hypothetical protein